MNIHLATQVFKMLINNSKQDQAHTLLIRLCSHILHTLTKRMCEVKLHIPINSLPTEVSPQHPPNSQFTVCHIQYRPPLTPLLPYLPQLFTFNVMSHMLRIISYHSAV